MPTIEEYLEAVGQRLAADGCAITRELIGSTPVIVGYKAEIKALSRMHVFTVAGGAAAVNEASLRSFVIAALNMARARKGQWAGTQSGILVLPVLVAPSVAPDAAAVLTRAYRLRAEGFAALAQPAVVDVVANQVHTFRGTRIVGYAFNGLIRSKCALYLPPLPTAALPGLPLSGLPFFGRS